MSRVCQVGNRPTVLLGTVLAALAAVVSQHYVGYCLAYREALKDAQTYRLARLAFQDEVLGEMPVPPGGFLEFLRWRAARGFQLLGRNVRGPLVWLVWTADAVLVLAAALALVVPALKRPYCDRCRSWFGTTRRGRIDPATARTLAALVEAELPDEIASARYRILACQAGCGPTGMELRCARADGARSSARVWLDAERRSHVVRALDQGTSQRSIASA
jgi:hypothetical protein